MPGGGQVVLRGQDYMMLAKPIDETTAYYVMVLNATEDGSFFFGQTVRARFACVLCVRGSMRMRVRKGKGHTVPLSCVLRLPFSLSCIPKRLADTDASLPYWFPCRISQILQNYYTEFDPQNKRLGFAPAVPDCRKAAGLKD